MKFAAVDAISQPVQEPTFGSVLPAAFDRSLAVAVAERVAAAARLEEPVAQ